MTYSGAERSKSRKEAWASTSFTPTRIAPIMIKMPKLFFAIIVISSTGTSDHLDGLVAKAVLPSC